MRRIYQWRKGGMVEVGKERSTARQHFVHGDEIAPLEHPGGGIFTSKRKLRQRTKELGWVEVGDESLKNQKRPDPKISDERILQAIEYQESVTSDPTKLRAWRNEMAEKRGYFEE